MWRPHDRDRSVYCLGIYSLGRNILGNNFMREYFIIIYSHDFIFDLNNQTLGIVKSYISFFSINSYLINIM